MNPAGKEHPDGGADVPTEPRNVTCVDGFVATVPTANEAAFRDSRRSGARGVQGAWSARGGGVLGRRRARRRGDFVSDSGRSNHPYRYQCRGDSNGTGLFNGIGG